MCTFLCQDPRDANKPSSLSGPICLTGKLHEGEHTTVSSSVKFYWVRKILLGLRRICSRYVERGEVGYGIRKDHKIGIIRFVVNASH